MTHPFIIDPALPSYDVMGIQKLIPHRYPFLMIDRAVNIVTAQSIVGIKNVSINEPHFTGHFPNHPVMPGVLIVEAMAQTSAVLVMHTLGSTAHGKVVYFMSVEGSKFRKPVVPGDVLHIHCEAQKSRGTVWRFAGIARVEGVKVAEAVYTAMIVDEKDEA
ncbi:MAG: 3-hydroxyacyl-ACP dehydratase FabZ [Alphaproteobacteria bacterium]|nr:3-hydroxyacyl-ACP dehydratase FabZ [Alphaproteobacteria bacterium]